MRRRRAAELYVVGTELGIDGVTYRSVLEHVGLPSDKNAQSAVRKAADTIRAFEPEDEIARNLFADWMNDFINARLDEDAGADHLAPGAPESAEHERDVKAKIGASLVLESYQGGDPMTCAEGCEACGLDRYSAADVNFLGVRVRALQKERAAPNVDAADDPASPPLGANRVGRAGRKRKQPGDDPAPAENENSLRAEGRFAG